MVPALVAGMVAGADSIEDMDLLRHGGMDTLFTGSGRPRRWARSWGPFTFGHVRQLDTVAATVLANLVAQAPILGGVDQVAYVDIDDTSKAALQHDAW